MGIFRSTVTAGSNALIELTPNTYGSPSTGVTAGSTLSTNAIVKGNANNRTVVTGDLQDSSNQLNSTSSTASVTFSGGQDTSASSALGAVAVRGGNQTGSGGSSSQGGGALLSGGSNAATNTSSVGGTVEVAAGPSTGSTNTGLQGLHLDVGSYAQSGTVTAWNLECFKSTAKSVGDCGANPSTIAGVAMSLSGTVQVSIAEPPSEVPVNASAAVTVGDTVCAGSTAGKVTDSGGTAPCESGLTVGVVIATSGTWPTLPDGTIFPTLSTTLPLVRIIYGSAGPVPAASADSTGNTGNISSTTIYSSAPAGLYRFTCYVVSTNAASSATLPQCSVNFTDKDTGTSETLAATGTAPTSATGTVTSGTKPIYDQGSANIGYSTSSYLAGSGTPLQYAVHVRLEYLGN